MKRFAGVVVCVVSCVAMCLVSVNAQTGRSPVEGVWKITAIEVTGPNPTSNSNPQPSQYIFTRGHFSVLRINGTMPRPVLPPLKTPGSPTDAEKVQWYEHWAPITAQSGTYMIAGNVLSLRPLVAKTQGVMAGSGAQGEFKLQGNDTLMFIQKSQDGKSTQTTTLKRME